MATDLGKAYVQIVPSAEGISGSIKSALGGEATSAGKQAGLNIAGAIKGAIAAAGIGTAIKSALDTGGDLQQSFGGLDTIYGDAAEAAKKYAAEAAKAGVSANSYAEQAVSFGASLKQAFEGDTVKAAEAANTAILDMTDNAAKMGTDIVNIQNAYQGFAKQNYTMLDNLKLGYGGTKQEMQRLLEDATKLSGIEYDISNLGDVYEAIHVIQGELGLTGVAAAEAEGTFKGSLGAIKASAENLLANLALGNSIENELRVLGENIQAFVFNNLLPMFGNIVSALPELVSGLGSMLIQGLNIVSNNADEIVQMGVDVVTSLVSAIVEAAPYLLEAAVSLVAALGQALIETDWVQVGTDLINSLKDSISLASAEIFGTDTTALDGFLQGITNSLPNVLSKGAEIISNLARGILGNSSSIITTAGSILNSFLGFYLENLPSVLETGFSLLSELVSGILSALPDVISSAVEVNSNFLATITEHLPDVLETGITIIGELTAGLIEAIPDLVGAIPEITQAIWDAFTEVDWLELGWEIIKGIVQGLSNAHWMIYDAIADTAGGMFKKSKDELEIHSPSKKGIWLGEMWTERVAVGVEDGLANVESAMSDLSKSATAQLNTSSNFRIDTATTSNDGKMDILLSILSEYLPEIAENKGITANDLYNGINRQLGAALS